jgi:hypothetical protein
MINVCVLRSVAGVVHARVGQILLTFLRGNSSVPLRRSLERFHDAAWGAATAGLG